MSIVATNSLEHLRLGEFRSGAYRICTERYSQLEKKKS